MTNSNSKMRVLIADDEPRARRRLAAMLTRLPGIEIWGEAGDGIQALQAIEREKPDVVLLDVQMPGLDGFEVLRELSGYGAPLVIFVTGHDQYALKAFEVSAVDFLLKPVAEERLKKAIDKARRILLRESGFSIEETMLNFHRLEEVLAKAQSSYLQRLVGRRGSRMQVLQVANIQAFLYEDDQVYAVVGQKERFAVNCALKDLETRLDPDCFVRVHKQAIVNLARPVEISTSADGGTVAKLECGLQITISVRQAALLKEKLKW